jgi:phage tail P2-like protein
VKLLPPNATSLERALEGGVARLSDVPVPLRALWNPATCPLDLLPYLAWALSIDGWSSDWPEAVKRNRVTSALAIQRAKGTASSVRSVVESFGGSVALKEWWQTAPQGAPHTFALVLDVDGIVPAERSAAFVDAVIAEVWRAKPVRSSFTFTQALTAGAFIRPVAAARPVTYARLQLAA